MSQNKPLTARQEAFCRHYVANGFNATQAAISAGYSEDSARMEGSRMLTNDNIKARIAELGGKVVAKTEKTAKDVAQLVTNIAFFDVRKVLSVRGNSVVFTVDDFAKLSDEDALMIQSIEEKITKEGTTIKVTFCDKMKAIDMLNRYHSMYRDQLAVKVEGELSPEELEELEELRLKQNGKPTDKPAQA
jgi:phage terminase small subunit